MFNIVKCFARETVWFARDWARRVFLFWVAFGRVVLATLRGQMQRWLLQRPICYLLTMFGAWHKATLPLIRKFVVGYSPVQLCNQGGAWIS